MSETPIDSDELDVDGLTLDFEEISIDAIQAQRAQIPALEETQSIKRQRLRKPKQKKGYHHGDLQRSLVDALLVLSQESNLHAVSLRSVAKQAGVSASATYRHFADKEALLAQAATEGFLRLKGILGNALSQEGGTELKKIEALFWAYIAFAEEYKAYFQIMFFDGLTADKYPELKDAAASALLEVIQVVQDGQNESLFRQDIETESLALSFWSCVHGLVSLKTQNRVSFQSESESFKSSFSVLLQGMRPLKTD